MKNLLLLISICNPKSKIRIRVTLLLEILLFKDNKETNLVPKYFLERKFRFSKRKNKELPMNRIKTELLFYSLQS